MLSKFGYSGGNFGGNDTPESPAREICLPVCCVCSGFWRRDIAAQDAVQVAAVENFQTVAVALQNVLAL